MALWKKILLLLVVAVVVLVVLPGALVYWRAWRAAPAYSGEEIIPGLTQPVRVFHEGDGVPHVYAESLTDLVLAQGYLHARERFWQMDMQRRALRGELSEVLGAATVEFDQESRRLGLGLVADRVYETMAEEQKEYLDRYAQGVNSYLDSVQGSPWTSRLPIEYAMLRNRPRPWKPADSIAVGLNMFRLLTNGWRSELARLQVTSAIPENLARDIYVERSQFDHPIADPLARRPGTRRRRAILAWNCRHDLEREARRAAVPGLDSLRLAASNNWVVSGDHTASGAAQLANDMHLGHTVPAVWFLNHLAGPELNVTGFSLPGLPFVIVGHNRDVAWGFTNLGADVQDLYVETFDPENPTRYLTADGWQEVERRVEVIHVRGEADVELEVLSTRHGPIVHEDAEFKVALRWTAFDATEVSLPFLRINQAANWEEFLAAMAAYGGPTQNAVYADREGHIGYHAIGRIPVRRSGDGALPVGGGTDDFEWDGYVDFEDLPQAFDPPTGVLATANNRVVPAGYPVHVTTRWMGPWRVHRIFLRLNEAIEEGRKLTRDDMLSIQGDVLSVPESTVVTHLLAAADKVTDHPHDRAEALALLRQWDGHMAADQAAPLIADLSRRRLQQALIEPALGEEWRNYNWWMDTVFLRNILEDRPQRWLPPGYPDYDALLLASLDQSVEEIRRRTGDTPLAETTWGAQLAVRMAHPVAGRIPVLRWWFSVEGQPQSGGSHTVKQTGRTFGVSERLVVDFGDLDGTYINNALGQSGHVASPHYRDQFEAWLEVRGLPRPFTRDQVEQRAARVLVLQP